MQSTTVVETQKASAYLTQLSKHFAHKVKVEQSNESVRFIFKLGVASVRVSGTILILGAEATTDEDLAQVETILGSHLERFAFRENVSVIWPRDAQILQNEKAQ